MEEDIITCPRCGTKMEHTYKGGGDWTCPECEYSLSERLDKTLEELGIAKKKKVKHGSLEKYKQEQWSGKKKKKKGLDKWED